MIGVILETLWAFVIQNLCEDVLTNVSMDGVLIDKGQETASIHQ